MNAKRGLVVLVVAVMAGSVSVEHDGTTHGVAAGGTQTFTAERQAESQESAAPQAVGKIVAGKPKYRPKNHEAWRDKGRIVGLLRHAPVCEIDVLDSSGSIVKSTRPKKGAHSYELQWLKPGKYDVRVSAKGYRSLELKGLEVKARNDLFMNLEFLPRGS